MDIGKLTEWFNSRPVWFKYGTQKLIDQGKLTESDFVEITDICLKRKVVKPTSVDINKIIKPSSNYSLHLSMISEVKGVNALAPRKPLNFGANNLTVVYGANGSGKSSYIRLLKNICDSRMKTAIEGNVYTTDIVEPSAKINYQFAGTNKELLWTKTTKSPELKFVDIYDSSYNDLFLKESDTVSYEPPLLLFFTQLIRMVQTVSNNIDDEIEKKSSTLPQMPASFQNTNSSVWFSALSEKISEKEIDQKCSFFPSDREKLESLRKRLAEQNPAEQAKRIRTYVKYLDKIHDNIKQYNTQFSVIFSDELQKLRNDCDIKEKASKAAAAQIKSQTRLEGLGESVWKELWNAAKSYSEVFAYKGEKYPNVKEGARCVLCHQLLDKEAKERLESFDEYIQGKTEQEYQIARSNLTVKIRSIIEIDSETQWDMLINAANISDELLKSSIVSLLKLYREKREDLINGKLISKDEDISVILKKVSDLKEDFNQDADKYDKDALKENRAGLKKEFDELLARQWLMENRNSIQDEIKRLKIIFQLREAQRETNTKAVATKKSELTESLITDEFIQRFTDELKLLGAKVSVDFVKDKTTKEKILYRICLHKACKNISPTEILSDGERRIVSIASFIADVLGRNGSIPFIFDDPISSLDQDYEENVVKRLVALAKQRQVIVFTHRISFMTLLNECAKNSDLNNNTICIRSECWGKGEAGGVSINIEKPGNVLKDKLQNMASLKRIYETEGQEAYYPQAKALCSDIRLLVERMVEDTLLNKVVIRFRRDITTKNKLGKLSKIRKEDCDLIDDFMTRYSCYEHPQTIEVPVSLPTPDEFKNDLQKLLDWNEEFLKR